MSTLFQLIRDADGAELIPLSKVACLIGRSEQTFYNQIHEDRCIFPVVRIGRRIYFRATDVASAIDRGLSGQGGKK